MQGNSDEEKAIFYLRENFEINKNKMKLFEKYIDILDSYQNKINLIGKSTRKNIWARHILDSAQIIKYLPKQNEKNYIIDVGTGAGFPGLVLSILGRRDIILCEKSIKKASFLKFVCGECKLNLEVYHGNIEEFKNRKVKIIISRAFSPLKNLLRSVIHIAKPDTIFIIHKGKKYMQEIEEAKKNYTFFVKSYKSVTDSYGKILKINNVMKKYDN